MSKGSPCSGSNFSPVGINVNSASPSIQRRISQMHAMRSTPIFFQVTHFMIFLRVLPLIFRAPINQVASGRNPALLFADIAARFPADLPLFFQVFSKDQNRLRPP